MEQFIWLFPIIFIFHDMEEIIGFGIWYKKNKSMLDERFPYISKTYKNFSTEGMAFAVYEELIVCILICTLTVCIKSDFTYDFWLGTFLACTIHFIVHIIQSIVIKQYIPATITSVLCLPISIWIIMKSITILNLDLPRVVLCSILGIIGVGLNLKFAQSLIGKFTLKMNL